MGVTINSKYLVLNFVLDGNSEIVVHERSGLGYLISLRHLIKTKAVTNLFF